MNKLSLLIVNKILPVIIVAMFAGMLWGRAILSISTIAFIVLSIFSNNFNSSWAAFRENRWLWLVALLFFVPFVSALWSEDKKSWLSIMEIKLPLLFLPFCSLVFKKFQPSTFSRINFIFIGLMLLACGYSTWLYLQDADSFDKAYLQAKVIPTLMDNDHLRFSWALLIAFILLVYETVDNFRNWTSLQKTFSISAIIFFAAFFHLLSAKTGVIGFYLVSFCMLVYFYRRKIKTLVAGMLLLLIAPLLAFTLVPTFQNRARFVWWDFQNYTRGNHIEGLSDSPRILSIRAGWQIFKNNFLLGTGFGDLNAETRAWYSAHADFLKEYEKLVPSSELLVYFAATGIFGGLIFCIAVLYPFSNQELRKNIFWICFHLIACFGFLYEIGFETQYGILLYCFFGCWLYWMLRNREEKTRG